MAAPRRMQVSCELSKTKGWDPSRRVVRSHRPEAGAAVRACGIAALRHHPRHAAQRPLLLGQNLCHMRPSSTPPSSSSSSLALQGNEKCRQ
eukprot:796205-Rhodomonas_salina.3